MTNQEVFEAMERGVDRFMVKRSKRIYLLDPAQRPVLRPFNTADVLLIGFPEVLSPMQKRRRSGRKWSWLAPKNLCLAPANNGGQP